MVQSTLSSDSQLQMCLQQSLNKIIVIFIFFIDKVNPSEMRFVLQTLMTNSLLSYTYLLY